ncbi:MAG: hypothetical protein ACLTQL_11580 [Eisenbergiella sp.]
MHLLDRLYDLPEGSGRITIGGVDIREISRSYLRGKVGIVLQEPFLFSRTIAENIRATRPGASLEAIRTAAGIACWMRQSTVFPPATTQSWANGALRFPVGRSSGYATYARAAWAPIMIFDDSFPPWMRKLTRQSVGSFTASLGIPQ